MNTRLPAIVRPASSSRRGQPLGEGAEVQDDEDQGWGMDSAGARAIITGDTPGPVPGFYRPYGGASIHSLQAPVQMLPLQQAVAGRPVHERQQTVLRASWMMPARLMPPAAMVASLEFLFEDMLGVSVLPVSISWEVTRYMLRSDQACGQQ